MNPTSIVNHWSAVSASLLTMIAARLCLRRWISDEPTRCASRPKTPASSYVGLLCRSWDSRPRQYVSKELWMECQCQYMRPSAPLARWLYAWRRS